MQHAIFAQSQGRQRAHQSGKCQQVYQDTALGPHAATHHQISFVPYEKEDLQCLGRHELLLTHTDNLNQKNLTANFSFNKIHVVFTFNSSGLIFGKMYLCKAIKIEM